MTRDEFHSAWRTRIGLGSRADFEHDLDKLIADVRSAILNDEERRVWMEEFARSAREKLDLASLTNRADRALARWREARAAWEARDG